MSSNKISTSLPKLPESLRPISPFIQRADELKTKDSVISYWCAYYAAQRGLELRIHEEEAKDYLFALITLLEQFKEEIRNESDTKFSFIDKTAAGVAYVEHFALRVFKAADDDDRKGDKGAISIAKKFLAAANFFEVLKVFANSDNAVANEDKLRYARWRASALMKSTKPDDERKRASLLGSKENSPRENSGTLSPAGVESPLARTPSDRSPVNHPNILPTEPKRSPRTPSTRLRQVPADIVVPQTDLESPGAWSSAATPGLDGPPTYSTTSSKLAYTSAKNRWSRQGEENLDVPPDYHDLNLSPTTAAAEISKKVHFSASVTGGLSSTDGSPPQSPNGIRPSYNSFSSAPQYRTTPGPSSLGRIDPAQTPLPDSSPSGSSLTSLEASPRGSGRPRSGSSPTGRGSKTSPPGSKRLSLQPSSPPTANMYTNGSGGQNLASGQGTSSQRRSPRVQGTGLPTHSPSLSGVPPPPPMYGIPSNASPVSASGLPYTSNYAPKPPSPPRQSAAMYNIELTPGIIAKVQKHARFAISALDYEDGETARHELQEALALLRRR